MTFLPPLRVGRRQSAERLLHMQKDTINHAIKALIDILIRHPEQPPAARFQIELALAIMFKFGIG